MIRPAPPSARGFTLVETLVALAIFAILASAATGILAQALQTGSANEQASDDVANLSFAHGIMRDDFLQMVPRLTRDGFGNQYLRSFEGGFIRDKTLIARLARRGRVNPGGTQRRGGTMAVQYLFENGQIIRRTWPQTDPTPDTNPYDQLLFTGVDRVTTRFLQNGAWLAVYETNSQTSGNLPLAVELILDFENGDRLRLVFQGMGERIS